MAEYYGDDLSGLVREGTYERLKTQADFVEYYQEKYPGKEGRSIAWKKHLVSDLLAERGITPENTDKKQYAKEKKSLDKRFEKRLSSPKAGEKNKAEYEALGKKLPPVPPKENVAYMVQVEGEIRINGTYCRPVNFTVTIGYAGSYSLQHGNAKSFTEEPTVEDLVRAYWQGDDPEDIGYSGWCVGPAYTITT